MVLGKDGRAVSLKRVTELTGKEIPFEKLDLMDDAKLEDLFSRVNQPLMRFRLFICFLGEIWCCFPFGRVESGCRVGCQAIGLLRKQYCRLIKLDQGLNFWLLVFITCVFRNVKSMVSKSSCSRQVPLSTDHHPNCQLRKTRQPVKELQTLMARPSTLLNRS